MQMGVAASTQNQVVTPHLLPLWTPPPHPGRPWCLPCPHLDHEGHQLTPCRCHPSPNAACSTINTGLGPCHVCVPQPHGMALLHGDFLPSCSVTAQQLDQSGGCFAFPRCPHVLGRFATTGDTATTGSFLSQDKQHPPHPSASLAETLFPTHTMRAPQPWAAPSQQQSCPSKVPPQPGDLLATPVACAGPNSLSSRASPPGQALPPPPHLHGSLCPIQSWELAGVGLDDL